MDIIRRDLKEMDWTSPGMKPKNWRQTEQNGVNVWPNAPIWMRDELRAKVGLRYLDLVPPLPSRASGDELSPSGMIAGSLSRVTPVHTHLFQIVFQCILPCPLWSSRSPSAVFWSPFQSQTNWSGLNIGPTLTNILLNYINRTYLYLEPGGLI